MKIAQDLVKGTVVPVVLKLLSEQEMYGYEIIKVVNQRTNNALEWKEGTLYPWLHRLETEGLIESHWVEGDTGRQRKYYRITRRGLAVLKEQAAEWTSFATAVNVLLMGQPATA